MCFFKSPNSTPPMLPPEAPPPSNDMEPDIGSRRKTEDAALTGTSQAPDLRIDRSGTGEGNRAGGTGLRM